MGIKLTSKFYHLMVKSSQSIVVENIEVTICFTLSSVTSLKEKEKRRHSIAGSVIVEVQQLKTR